MKHTISKINYWVQHSIFFVSLIIFILNISMLYTYDNYSVSFQYIYTLKFIGYYVYLGIDSISIAFTLLTSFIIPLCFLFVWPSKFKYKTEYFICLFSIELLIIVVFSVLDLFWFFVLFEAILIPFFLLIGLYGSRVRKIHAAYLLFFYTVLGSLLMLISIIYIYLHTGTTNIQLLWKLELDELAESLIWASFFFIF
jgi:NADH:ubiquinone oxidoreductase subunit 4 (subunit M)